MTLPRPTIALFAKYPVPGEVKTRLIPALGAQGAAVLHRQLVESTLEVIGRTGLPCVLYFSGAEREEFAQWLGPQIALAPQGYGDLGARLARVPAPTILLGADIPDVTPAHLIAAEKAMDQAEVVIGPAADGGYYLLGYRKRVDYLFADMEWGVGTVRAETIRRLEERGTSWRELAMLHDCDRPEDLARWPDLAR